MANTLFDLIDESRRTEQTESRLLDCGREAMTDADIVDYLLALAMPGRDTRPIAEKLLDRFGGFQRLLHAEPAAIMKAGRIDERAAGAIKIVAAGAVRLLEARRGRRDILGSWQALLDYLQGDMAGLGIERVRVLFLDAKNALIRDVAMWEGSADESAVYIREIIKRALAYEATAVIIVHNHPSGDPTPSQQDIRLTRDLNEALKHVRVTLHDHVIVGDGKHSSLRAMGII